MLHSKPHHIGLCGDGHQIDGCGGSSFGPVQGYVEQDALLAIGRTAAPPDLAINGFADAAVAIGLQGATPADAAHITVALGTTVNFAASGYSPATGSVTSTASGQGILTLTNGVLNGAYSAALSIDLTAYLPADKAAVTMHVTDDFTLSLSGSGYTGGTLAQQTASGGTVQAMTPAAGAANNPGRNDLGWHDHGTFDLARFAASVLGQLQWDIGFVAAAPGETLHAVGTSVLAVNATADLASGCAIRLVSIDTTQRSGFDVGLTAAPAWAAGPYDHGGPLTLFHA